MRLTKEEVLSKDLSWKLDNVVEYADYLAHDNSISVRRLVVKYGNDSYMDILVHDKTIAVRELVAKYGNDSHRDILVHVEDRYVSDVAKKYLESTYHKVSTGFGTYNGNLDLWVWSDKYLIESGCYKTDDIGEWFNKCKSQFYTETATKYTKIMKDIIEKN